MEITFVRHTEKECDEEKSPLTKRGIKQAKYLAKRLKKEKFDEFFCSDLTRAKQTASIITEKIRINPKIETSLNEFESKTIAKKKDKWSKEERNHYDELVSFLKRITSDPSRNKSILIVAHGTVNRIILSYFLNLNVKRLIPFRQAEGGINAIYWSDKFKNWRLKFWNDYSHLPSKINV